MNFSLDLKYSHPKHSRIGLAFAALGLLLVHFGCADPEEGLDGSEYFGGPGTYSTVSDPIAFTEEPYDFTGPMPIGDLRALVPDDTSEWYGFSPDDPYPVEGDCNPEFQGNEAIPEYLDELPAVIEGVVTLHPRYFSNMTVCGTRERYYGTYVIQDETGGIQVMKNSRLAEFDVGDRVRMRVRGITREFDTVAILAFDQEEVVTTPETRLPVYYEELTREFISEENVSDAREEILEGLEEDETLTEAELDEMVTPDDTYLVRRIRGEVILEATNQNFNEMRVQSNEDPDVEWLVSLDRELGTRGVGPKKGDQVQLTGPVVNSFGMRILIASLGKIEILEEAGE